MDDTRLINSLIAALQTLSEYCDRQGDIIRELSVELARTRAQLAAEREKNGEDERGAA